MSALRLLRLDAAGLSAWRWSGAGPVEEGRYRNDAAGHDAFSAYLLDHSRSPYRLLADLQDESFGFESIPFVTGADRRALIARRLKQHFPGAAYTCAISHGREPAGRRDERVLLLALPRSRTLAPWLARMRAAEIELAGIHSAPQACQSLAEAIAPGHGEHLLLVTDGAAGVRQTYFAGGILRFSRLSAAADASAEERARLCAQEPARLYEYLVSQRILERGSRLPTLVLCPASKRAAAAQACRSTNQIAFGFADLGAAEVACGMKPAGEPSSADRLLLHLIAKKPPRAQFAGEAERHLYHIGRLRFAMLSASALVLAGCLLASARHLHEAHSARENASAAAAAANEDAQRYAGLMKRLPAMPAPLPAVRRLVERHDAIERDSGPIEPMLQRVSHALEVWRQVELDRLDWQLTRRPEPGGEGRREAPIRGREGPTTWAVAQLSASLPRLPPDERRLITEAIDGFAAALASHPDTEVHVVQRPFDPDRGRALAGGAADASPAPARFVLRVSHPVGASNGHAVGQAPRSMTGMPVSLTPHPSPARGRGELREVASRLQRDTLVASRP